MRGSREAHHGHGDHGHGDHGHAEHDQAGHGRIGDVLRGARRYELVATIACGGRRKAAFDEIVRLSGAAPGDRVLDVGCGTGYLTRRTAVAVCRGGADGRVSGLDPSPPMVAYAARTAPGCCTFQLGVAQQLPYRRESFDVVVTSLALHHVPAKLRPAAVGEMLRVLRPGGRVLVVELHPLHTPLAIRLAQLTRLGPLGRLFGRGDHGHHHDRVEGLADLVADAGFEVLDSGELRHRLTYLLAARPAAAA